MVGGKYGSVVILFDQVVVEIDEACWFLEAEGDQEEGQEIEIGRVITVTSIPATQAGGIIA